MDAKSPVGYEGMQASDNIRYMNRNTDREAITRSVTYAAMNVLRILACGTGFVHTMWARFARAVLMIAKSCKLNYLAVNISVAVAYLIQALDNTVYGTEFGGAHACNAPRHRGLKL